jgi:hypothetical protein
MGEMEGMGSGDALTGELPKGVLTMATRCYSPSCTEDRKCYSPRCPYKADVETFLGRRETTPLPTPARTVRGDWSDAVDPIIMRDLTDSQKRRQTIIHQAIQSETQYEADLTATETLFIQGLRESNPQIISPIKRREDFILQVFSNILSIREATRRLLENFAIRQREQPLILTVGDIFLEAAADFHDIYPQYTGNLPYAETALSREIDDNPDFRLFTEVRLAPATQLMIAHRERNRPPTRRPLSDCATQGTATAISTGDRCDTAMHRSIRSRSRISERGAFKHPKSFDHLPVEAFPSITRSWTGWEAAMA